MKLIMAFLSLLVITASAQNKQAEMPAIFSDNMVLQQNTSASFWGKAEPGTQVNINASWGESASGKVGDDGSWLLKLKTIAAGGPYDLSIKVGSKEFNYKNVLLGEVWICSGQSNMEMPLQGWPPNDTILYSAEEISKANYDKLRFFTVVKKYSSEEQFNCTGNWQVCTPENAAAFSATGFFFGKKLLNELNIPIGLIHTSWGGTPVESWTNGKYLETVDQFKDEISALKNSSAQFKKYNEWLISHKTIDVNSRPSAEKWQNLEFDDVACAESGFTDDNWKEMSLPVLWESSGLGNFDGVVWFRKEIELPSTWSNNDLVLELGPIDDMDRTYVNGRLVGSYEKDGFYNVDRMYQIPKEVINSKIITIAVRVMDTQGGGGIYGAKEKLKLSNPSLNESLSLTGKWKYLPTAEYTEQKFFVFGAEKNDYNSRPKMDIALSAYTPTALYNGMINPLVPYSIKGAIWYQGEANTGNPSLYAKLLPLMIENWRSVWQSGDFSFYFAQIAPYDYGEGTPSQKLREAQMKTMSVPHTGMAVTLDIGNPKNIHPANKKDVGERLALWALAKDYKKNVSYSGPVLKSTETKDNKIILSFDYAGNGLKVKEHEGNNYFLVAGEDKVFMKADIKVEGDKIILSNSKITKPVAARYAWSNTADGTLFNDAGLPASSFRTDNWD